LNVLLEPKGTALFDVAGVGNDLVTDDDAVVAFFRLSFGSLDESLFNDFPSGTEKEVVLLLDDAGSDCRTGR
jgi:hypothetical protein